MYGELALIPSVFHGHFGCPRRPIRHRLSTIGSVSPAPGGTEDYFRDIAFAMADEATTEATLVLLAEHHGIELLDRY